MPAALGMLCWMQNACSSPVRGNEIRLSTGVFTALSEELQAMFTFDSKEDCYKGSAVTWSKVEDKQITKQYAAKAAVGFHEATRQIHFRPRDEQPAPNVLPLKNTS